MMNRLGRHVYYLDPDELVLFPTDVTKEPGAGTRGEMYLRLVDLDLDDAHSILEFVNSFSILNVHEATLPNPSFSLPLSSHAAEEIESDRRAVGEVIAEERGWSSAEEAARSDFDVETVESFRVGARLIRDGLRAWRVVKGDINPLTTTWETRDFLRLKARHLSYEVEAEDFLTSLFDDGLRPFHPGISFEEERDLPPDSPRVEVVPASSSERQTLDLYPVCCLELFNHIIEMAEYRICANTQCHRLFVRQEGRASYGQHRTRGVLYCTRACARSQAQRAYRARQGHESAS
jgi:hypothetical protein